ncbi:1-aminocyclopropane-1-carboxylate oxidase homolog 1 [Arachis duranensis]|uniref:1-aminocyclopropane-1-carboxylate oxidase homolog 1 n=1 Tax=Arachis duranensis TaxID=130453 RepID=A0A6P4DKH1_ARADU|nr:1-aminocyclopropane-1-carboxylate oxidase homolog 1 [Arachis duranensis]
MVEADHEHGDYDRNRELKLLDETKAGVKGLVDAGLSKLSKIFVHDSHKVNDSSSSSSSSSSPPATDVSIPVIDLGSLHEEGNSRHEIVQKVKDACEKWGFFQVVNHDIPQSVLDEMLDGVRRFHEQDAEVKKEFYSRDITKRVFYNTNFNFYTASEINWRDTLYCLLAPGPLDPHQLPSICRDITIEYSDQVKKLALTLLELLSEALDLESSYLKDIDCGEGIFMVGHYYPPCPEPELTWGIGGHTDIGFVTVLLQDQVGGLQVFHEDQWIDVTPIPGAFIINLGDMMQLITNDKFMSAMHRVVAQKVGPRISVAYFLRQHVDDESPRMYGPIKELLTEDNPPIYKEMKMSDLVKLVYTTKLVSSPLNHFRL